jgi:hypothetical protein
LDDSSVGRWSLADRRLRIERIIGRYVAISLAVDADKFVFGAGPMPRGLGGYE